ncbi:GNAT family N-acetyltransferase [Xylophilus sp. GOD-11R]|uniref:GNAT family N-acetyltransferase n=1 Tax=Xylophilus sp. GOD-11R TaxID=3089814 RepID=UPI00298C3E86|nr:GNAT family N-acetyltransferase [Xylophilus sp. GOD-11R]WPB57419.1 GNAT family N-acetyltransferase [Xylophilus sp. GOD-11R]
MSSYLIINRHSSIDPYLEDLANIYSSNGWGSSYQRPLLRRMYSNCEFFLALNGGTAVGLLRAFGDGVTVTHLSEVLTERSFHRNGVATALMNVFVNEFKHTAIYAEALDELIVPTLKKFNFQSKARLHAYARKATFER